MKIYDETEDAREWDWNSEKPIDVVERLGTKTTNRKNDPNNRQQIQTIDWGDSALKMEIRNRDDVVHEALGRDDEAHVVYATHTEGAGQHDQRRICWHRKQRQHSRQKYAITIASKIQNDQIAKQDLTRSNDQIMGTQIVASLMAEASKKSKKARRRTEPTLDDVESDNDDNDEEQLVCNKVGDH